MPNQDLEKSQFERFLESTGNTFDHYSYRDKPDVSATKDGTLYGIELTDCCPEELHRARVVARKNKLKSYCVSHLEDNSKEKRRNNQELMNAISTARYADSEKNGITWSNRIASRILRKSELLESGEIERFEKNWLVIVDSSSEPWALENEFYRVALMGSLGASYLNDPKFDITYVLSGRDIFIIDKQRTNGIRIEN